MYDSMIRHWNELKTLGNLGPLLRFLKKICNTLMRQAVFFQLTAF